jgi:hypothetical protein
VKIAIKYQVIESWNPRPRPPIKNLDAELAAPLKSFFMSLNQRYQLWLQHDGAPPYYSVLAREELQMQFGENWIGRRGPINWPARSPDSPPPDFFVGYN